MSFWAPASRARRDAKMRARVYRELDVLLRNGVSMDESLAKIHQIASDFGRSPNSPKAVMVADLRSRPGEDFQVSIARWAPPLEATMIGIGFQTGKMSDSFAAVDLLLKKRSELRETCIKLIPYPVVLVAMTLVMLVNINNDMTPALLAMAPASEWKGAAALLMLLGKIASAIWMPLAAVMAGLAIAIPVAFPRLTGDIRYRLEVFGPFKYYRIIVGAFTLYTYSVLVHRGVPENDALKQLLATSNPYLRERLVAILRGTGNGRNIGTALREADFNFPDKESIAYVELLAGKTGFAAALSDFSKEMLSDYINRLKEWLVLIATVCLLFAIGVSALNALSAFEINSVSRSMMSR
ncbi:type II secretion system F family protein [Xanthomonas perforans]|uniref:type II secretion system F family protein n=1 Tax=Xanthomonas perforans TaxID=442694 RepID=UPI00235883E0|nr:type II secretion system F family protein [Xanthomonas perforans]MDC9654337.1 type II secretion system F family protein [Xanthomonas perforans]